MMAESNWRWLAIVLLACNITLGFVYLLTDDTNTSQPQEIPPLDPSITEFELVGEATREPVDGAGREFCYTIGPLPTLLAQQRAEERLRPFAADLRLRRTSADHDRGWWVYLPANTRSEALDLTRELAESGVEDYYVVAGGDMENSVSVGLFENLDNARSRQSRIRSLGFNAQIEIRRESIPQFWVDYRLEAGETPPWRFILSASPGAQQVEIPCFAADSVRDNDQNATD